MYVLKYCNNLEKYLNNIGGKHQKAYNIRIQCHDVFIFLNIKLHNIFQKYVIDALLSKT